MIKGKGNYNLVHAHFWAGWGGTLLITHFIFMGKGKEKKSQEGAVCTEET